MLKRMCVLSVVDSAPWSAIRRLASQRTIKKTAKAAVKIANPAITVATKSRRSTLAELVTPIACATNNSIKLGNHNWQPRPK